MASDPKALLPLPAHVLQILLALHEHEQHGYGLLQSIERRTGGEMALGTSTLYASLSRLRAAGLIADSAPPADADSGDERRKYFRITPFGIDVVREEALRIRRLNRMIGDARVLAPAARSARSWLRGA